MINAEIYQREATSKLAAGQLKGTAREFIERVQFYNKNDLKNLSSKQFMFLRRIATGK